MNAPQKDSRLFAPLAIFNGATPPAPHWFKEAMQDVPEVRSIEVEGAAIETLVWGDAAKPGLLLLHGNGAHAGWWRFIAPFFLKDYRVVALSWSGMGNSGWRETYTLEHFVAEVMTVAKETGLFGHTEKPVAIGHSFGSFPLVQTAVLHGDQFKAAIIVDSPFFSPERREARRKERGDHARRPRELGPHKVYPTFEAALARFRLAPLQPCENLFIADLIAKESLKAVPMPDGSGAGWTWRFDPFLWRAFKMQDLSLSLHKIGCKSALIRGSRSQLMHDEDAAYTLSLMPEGSPFIDIPDADHHVMIDQPLAFVASIRSLLSSWAK